ncbi:MAG: OmpH family outer membrane protein [Bacteroidales bacterium]|nr:OmpH family outer membrane protein [Candidatus Physcousia equi]
MKKLFFLASAMLMIMSCGGKTEDEVEETKNEPIAPNSGLRIAFVEVDSLMTQYQFCKDYTEVMAVEYANIQKELAAKQHTLQQHAASMQKKYESNGFTTRDELERAQAGIQREEQELAALSDRLSAEFANTQAAYNDEMRDSIQAFLKVYNKKKKYDYILSKGGDNMLYANPAYDITNDVIKGLNKRYKVKPEVAAKLKKANEDNK